MSNSPEKSSKPESASEKGLRLLRVGNYIGIAAVATVAAFNPEFLPVAAGLIALDIAQIGLYKHLSSRSKRKRNVPDQSSQTRLATA